MVLVEQQYKDIRQKLDQMGYHQPCSVESMILVDRLLNELICTRDKIVLNEEILSSTMKKYEQMENSLEFCKQENTRLIKENNKMHLNKIQCKEDSEKKIKELKNRIIDLENMYSDLEFNYMEQMTTLGTIQQELQDKTKKLHELGIHLEEVNENMGSMRKSQFNKKNNSEDHKNKFNNNEKDQVEYYKIKQRQLMDEIETLKSQLQSRDREIARLGKELEEAKTYMALKKEKCSCHFTNSLSSNNQLTIDEMYDKIRIAQDKQHEAMERAVILADHIQELETELITLKHKSALENQCSCGTNITFLKKQHAETINRIHNMEKRITNLQTSINNLSKEKEDATEKIAYLEKEKGSLSDKIENFKIIERDLISEVDRLQKKIADLKDEVAKLVEKNGDLQDLLKKSTSSTNKNRSTTETENVISNDYDKLYEKIKAERNYYCNELRRLQEKFYSADHLHSIKCHSEYANKILIQKIESELHFAKEENKRYQEEISTLKNQLKEFSAYKCDANKLVENHIKKLEYNKSALESSNSNLKSKLHSVEKTLEQLRDKERLLTEEIDNYKVKYNSLKKLNIQLELSLQNREAMRKQVEIDLYEAMARLSELEKELRCSKEEIITVKKEKQEVKENLLRLDSEKDELLLKLDEKTIVISKLDRDLQSKSTQILQIENKKCELQTELQTVKNMLQDADHKCKVYAQENRKLQQELISLHASKENLLSEYESLKRELEAVSKDVILTNQALEKSRKESENLKRELQSYVDEVRRVEKILLEKERERDTLLEQFKVLSAEAIHLESNQQSLEFEANLSKDSLRDTTEKLYAVQKDASAKDSLVEIMKSQVQQLSDQVIQLQEKVAEMNDRELMLTSDLEAARNLCSNLEDQKHYYNVQLSQLESSEKMLRDELSRLECENETLHNQLSHEQQSSSSLEKIISSTRNEAMEKCLYNEDLTKDVNKMKNTIVTLERKLNSVKSTLSECQSACADYHSQNVQLRRQITNERFEKAKDLDSNSTSL